jgi:hypothetical protein
VLSLGALRCLFVDGLDQPHSLPHDQGIDPRMKGCSPARLNEAAWLKNR